MSRASDHAYRFIRAEILSGSLAPGEQVREEQLADVCGVSRTPVREALRRLEAERFVHRNDSQRTFVTNWSMDEVEESFALRGILEGRAAARAATRITAADIDQLDAHNRAIQKAIEADRFDLESFIGHNRAFHGIILEAAASHNLAQLLGRIVEQPIIARTARQYDRAQLVRSVAEHDEIILAFRRRDSAWAEAVMTAHIRRAFHAFSDARAAAPDNKPAERAA